MLIDIRFIKFLSLVSGLVLLLSWFLSRVPLQSSLSFSLGSMDPNIAHGFHAAETATNGRGFRWTTGDSYLDLPAQSNASHLLELTMSAPRPIAMKIPVTITINEWSATQVDQTQQLRHYLLFVPESRIRLANNTIGIHSSTFSPDEHNQDSRQLGVAVFSTRWHGLRTPIWILPVQIFSISIVGILLFLFLRTAGIESKSCLLVLLLFIGITVAMRHSDTRFIYRWYAVFWTIAIGVVCLGAWLSLLRCRVTKQSVAPLSHWIAWHWSAVAGYIGLTSILLGPLLLKFHTHIVGFPGDAYEYLWKMQWFSDALLRKNVSPAFAPEIFYPVGYELALSEMTPAHTLLGVPITWLFGAIVGYNFVILSSFVLTAIFTYLLALRVGASRGPAFVAGIIFAFCVRRYYHSSGHLPMMGTQWIALALYGWEGVLTRRRSWDGFITGLGFAMTVWSSWYFGTTLALLLAAYAPLRMGWRGLSDLVKSWSAIVVAAVVSIALVLPLAQPYIEARQTSDLSQHSYIHLLIHSVLLREFLLPNPYHPLWGNWAMQFFRSNGGENVVALGYSVLILSLVGIWIGRRQPVVQALSSIALINLVMTLGPEYYLPNGSGIFLPAHFIYYHVPILDSIRVWSRMVLYVTLCTALLSSLALTGIAHRWRRIGWITATLLVIVEYGSVFPLNAPRPRMLDQWLSQQPGNGAVIELPMVFNPSSLYYTLFSEKPINGGYGTFEPLFYKEGLPILRRFPHVSAIDLMRRWQTEYVIVNEYEMNHSVTNWEAQFVETSLLDLVHSSEGFRVYQIRP